MKKIKSFIKKVIKYLIPVRKTILFESFPDFSDSMINVYNEFVKRGIDKKYKLVWYTDDGVKQEGFKTTPNSFLRTYYLYSSKILISSNRILYKQKNKQKTFYIAHGNPTKQTRNYYYFNNDIDYFICFSKYFEIQNSIEKHQPLEKCFGLGLPRNDKLFEKINLSSYFGKYKKFIFWYPTVKYFKGGRKAGNSEAIPFLDNIVEINECARKNDVCIVAKIHFANIDIDLKDLSNIKFVSNDFYEKLHLHHYSCIGSSDALITDYSSIFYDYLYVNKPICLIWNDVDEYAKNPGLTYDFYIRDSKIATICKDVDSLGLFIGKVAKGQDDKKELRERLIKNTCLPSPGSITSNVCDFILEKINESR